MGENIKGVGEIELVSGRSPCFGSLELATLLGPLPFCEFGGFGISRAR